jgi:hypothetical protein
MLLKQAGCFESVCFCSYVVHMSAYIIFGNKNATKTLPKTVASFPYQTPASNNHGIYSV